MDRLIQLLATGLYTGYLPWVPGTWGTLVAFPLHALLCRLQPLPYTLLLASLFLVAVLCAGGMEKIVDHPDPGIIVIDEIIGMLIGLIGTPMKIAPLLCAFVLFRLFDILKPFPVGWLDSHLNGGIGIVMDDVAAGIYTLLIMRLASLYFSW